MATISLGKAPKSFKKIVSVPMHDGTTGAIECLFKYRTAIEYGDLVDRMNATPAMSLEPGEQDLLGQQLRVKTRRNAEFLLEVLEGWNLDVPLTLEAAIQLCDELPGAADETFEVYRRATVEGRLGN
jgi:hypothetical protein